MLTTYWTITKSTDLFTTYNSFEVENNPFMYFWLHSGGYGLAIVILGIVALILRILEKRYESKYFRAIMIFGIGLNIFITIWNTIIFLLI